jgi:hypothetical protein
MKVLVMSHKEPFEEEVATSVYSTYQNALDVLVDIFQSKRKTPKHAKRRRH